MSAQQDLQDLLRLMTTGRNKVTMLAAMGRIKALQAANIRNIAAIASADSSTLKEALNDEKAAKQLQSSAKVSLKEPSKKRSADTPLPSLETKRKKSAYELDTSPQTPQALEASLELPTPSADEEEISKTTIITNRAPLVLAFAVQLLKYTMPEQPLSSRLSLAQAVVSANSKTKALSLGISKGTSAEMDGWGHGQPRVRVMGREVYVLKRGGYEWKSDPEGSTQENLEVKTEGIPGEGTKANGKTTEENTQQEIKPTNTAPEAYSSSTTPKWAVSQPITLKKSTFIARSISITSPHEARTSVEHLLQSNPDLRAASHNIHAFRVAGSNGGIIESSADDGESGGGRHLLALLQSLNLVNVLLVVTRWYGGIMLGPDRWRLMSEVARDALSQRLRVAGIIGQEALWGLDLEKMREANSSSSTIHTSSNSSSASVGIVSAPGIPIHTPESARSYILKAFAPADEKGRKKSGVALEREKERNLGLVLGALDLLFKSWKEHIGREELDRRAWGWYVSVRPEVEAGAAGWGGKGEVRLKDILALRRKG